MIDVVTRELKMKVSFLKLKFKLIKFESKYHGG